MLEHTSRLVRLSLRFSLEPRHVVNNQLVRLFDTSSQQCKDDGYEDPRKDKRASKKPYYMFGAVIIGTGSFIAYAKQDDDFRRYLSENFPLADSFVSFATAEEMSRIDYVLNIVAHIKSTIVDEIFDLVQKRMGYESTKDRKKSEICEDIGKPFRAPPSAFKDLTSNEGRNGKYEEARISELLNGGDEKIKTASDSHYKNKSKVENVNDHNLVSPDTLVSLEKEINEKADTAIRAYILAGCYIREFSEDLCRLLEASIEKADRKLWAELRKKGEERDELVERAETSAREAEEKLSDLQERLDEPDLPGGEEARAMTKRNIEKVLNQLKKAKADYYDNRNNSNSSERLRTKVIEARMHFMEEIEMLNPQFRLNDKQIKLPDAEMNLFIHNAILNVLHLQKEFMKMDTINKAKVKAAIERSRKKDPDAVDEAIELGIEKEKRKISLEYYKKLLTVKAECEHQTKQALKNGGGTFEDILEDALAQKEKEVLRDLQRHNDEELMSYMEKPRNEMAVFLGRLKGMDDLMKDRACNKKRSDIFWSACEALQTAVTGTKEFSNKPVRSIDMEIKAIKNVTDEKDDFVAVVMAALPDLAATRGVYSAPALKERYLTMHRVASRVGFLPEGGGSLPSMLIGFIKAILIITPANPIPCHELLNEPFDPAELDNFEILQRAQFYMDKGDWYMVLSYLNLLKGASRAVSSNFINELRLYLETKAIADSLMCHAAARFLAF
ncbi:mitochondrial inner membrane [Nesidiocoris tenuis]|uniref:MICOS complex subunit MIC60 n=1 Tax=Nesidiocoris tenuis TaxID=355587 RepID=A0ABN7B0Q0_9HEMI|nr:mitochondrial inner membrane [Nesidiocoris tenuis]